MKLMKRAAGMLLAFAMILMMNTTVLGAAMGRIILENPRDGQVYTAYKIFDVDYNGDLSSYAYTIAGDSEWFETVSGYEGFTLEKLPDENVYNVIENDSYSAPRFAEILKAACDGKTGQDLEIYEGQGYVNVRLGYYFVKSTSGALCNLTTTDPVAIIRDKNDLLFEKTDDAESVEVGQTVHYVVSGRVPETTGFASYTYKISDTMSDGLTFNKDVKVFLADVQMNDGYTLANREDGTGFDLTIDVLKLTEQAGDSIEIKYSATVNENAVAQVENNSAYLEYSNNPVDGTLTVKTPAEEETVYSAKIAIDKYEADNETKKLPYAEFVLINSEGKFYKWDKSSKKVTWVDSQDNGTVAATDEEGAAEFLGLADGIYQVKEIKAPNGYNLMTEPVEVVVNGSEATIENSSVLIQPVEVPNKAGSILPETGGSGTKLFYMTGGALVLGATILLVLKEKRNSAHK